MRQRTGGFYRRTLVLRPRFLKRHLFLCPAGILFGTVLIWAAFTLPSSTLALALFNILGSAIGAFFFLGGLLLPLAPWLGFQRLELEGSRLTSTGIFGRSIMDLNEWGEAGVIHTSRATWLGFFTLEEERALAAKGKSAQPRAFNATKLVALAPFIGSDFQRAREFADEINSRRGSFDRNAVVADPDAVIRKMKQRNVRRLAIAFLSVTAVVILGMWSDRDFDALQKHGGKAALHSDDAYER